MRASGTRKHRESLPHNFDTTPFWRAVTYLLTPPYSPARLTALFGGRAAYGAIRNWRYGHCGPPLWVAEILHARIDEKLAELERAAQILDKCRRRNTAGERGTRHLAAWRERKARERDENEKNDL